MKSELLMQSAPVDLGRLMETVHAQQSQIHGVLATLEARSRDLDTTLGESVQRAFMDAAGLRAAEKLSEVQRATALRFARWAFGVVSICALVPAFLSWMLLPTHAQVLQTRDAFDKLSAGVAQLSRDGGRIELRHCGESDRLCVRIDRKSPFYGESADYAVVKGY